MSKINLIFTAAILSAAIIFQISVSAQTENLPSDESKKFDFWVGEWDVFKNDTLKVGDSRIEKILQDAVILENYTAFSGYEGKSFNYFDKVKNKWIQFWVDKNAESIFFEGNFDDTQNALVYFSYDLDTDEKPFIRRMRFFNFEPNTVRQFSERTYNDGDTWHVEYDLLYKRKVK